MVLSLTNTLLLFVSVIAGPVPARLLRVVDGDTVRVEALIWIGQSVEVNVRLAGVDAPEIFRPACPAEREKGRAALAFVEAMLAGEVAAALYEVEADKYGGRVVARLETADGEDVGASLIAAGLAAPIAERRDWCAVRD
jgi:endonuclease YncB( thermonuclease family)